MRLPRLPRAFANAIDAPLPLWPPVLATRGPGESSDLHSHHAMHFVLARAGRLRVRIGTDPRDRAVAAGVLTAPDVPHALEAEGVEVLLVFLDPESTAGSSLARALTGPAVLLDEAQRDALVADAEPIDLMGAAGRDWVERAVGVIGGATRSASRPIHPRVREVLQLLQTGAATGTDLESLADAVGLSAGRLMHVFTESIGIPLRPYLAWLKLQRACAAISVGAPLADAAQAGGFADAAHLTRTVRRMLGATPSQLRRRDAATRG